MCFFSRVLLFRAGRWLGLPALVVLGLAQVVFAQESPQPQPAESGPTEVGQPAAFSYPAPYPISVFPVPPPPPALPTVVAASPAPETHQPPLISFGASLSSSVVSESNSTSVLFSPLLDASVALHRMILLHAAWGFAWMLDGQGLGESTIRSGNPMLGGIVRLGDGPWRLRAELDVTVPFAHVPLNTDGRTNAFTYNHTMAMWGMWNQWLWSTDQMAVPIQANFAYAPSTRLWLVVEAAGATLIGARKGAGGSKIVGQLAVEAQIEVAQKLTVCPRWQTVRLPAGGIDTWQSSAGLRVVLATTAGKFFVGALVNVDEPLGIFGGLGRWGFHLGKEIGL